MVDQRCFGRNTRPKPSSARRFGRAPLIAFFFSLGTLFVLWCTTCSAAVLACCNVSPACSTVSSPVATGVAGCCCMWYWYWMADALCGRPEACPRGVLRGTPVLDVSIVFFCTHRLEECPTIFLFACYYDF